ncbi:hypothetical protein HPB49_011341 [Dermacentor silvarum]|uniref:Uncharacterized protein n=1 Tax=Dermacentor silvarum TaxID=543639 RepID=A0ACB8D4Z3_DERSI|nr:hypothetical protein HPB49_011341 [Dermacentor silvarum]
MGSAAATPIYLTVKKEQLTKDNRCFRCTSRGHRANDRGVKLTRSSCRGRHASSMSCDANYKRTTTTTATTSPPGSSTVETHSSTGLSSCENLSPSNQRNTDNAVYQQTFFTQIVNNDKTRYVHGVLDGGRQRSFIEEDAALKLKRKAVRNIPLALNTFGSTCPSVAEKLEVVEVPLRNRYTNAIFSIEAVVVLAILP